MTTQINLSSIKFRKARALLKAKNEKSKTRTKKVIDKPIKSPRSIRGKNSLIRGYMNENASIRYILDNYAKYGVPDRQHIYCTPRGGVSRRSKNKTFHTDLFQTKYLDAGGNEKAAGFDIIGISDSIYFPFCLVQVKSTKRPSRLYMKTLADFPTPNNIIKELHIWKYNEETNQSTLEIINLNEYIYDRK